MSLQTHANQATMLLDIGNTNLKWMLLHDRDQDRIISVAHQGRSIAGLATEQWSEIEIPSQTLIANVAGPEIEQPLSAWISENWKHKPSFVRSAKFACGVTNSYPEPERLGVDRWLTLIALVRRISTAVCVVDCGTAVTIDAMSSDGRHRGGLILPGFGLMRESLVGQTAIPIRGEAEIGTLLATDTESAIANGGVNAVAALVEKIQKQLAETEQSEVSLVLTGSDASMLAKVLSVEADIESGLVMQGLIEFARTGLEQET